MSVGAWSEFYTPYNEPSVFKYAPVNEGVYTLWIYYKTGRWGCFYVGKTDNLESRLLSHLESDESNKCIKGNIKYKCGFMWIGITTEEERSGVEKYLYDAMKPGCNQNDPGGKPLKIQLPPTPPATEPSA